MIAIPKLRHGTYGGFLSWWYPTTIGFPTKNDHFGVFLGEQPPFKETPKYGSPEHGRQGKGDSDKWDTDDFQVSIRFKLCGCGFLEYGFLSG